MLSIVSEDEVPHANEYDCDPTYEDQEALAEEVEEQKERVSSPCHHRTISYDISDLLGHDDKIIEDDDYWKFMGPSLYESLRPGSVVSRLCSDEEEVDESNMDQLEIKFYMFETTKS